MSRRSRQVAAIALAVVVVLAIIIFRGRGTATKAVATASPPASTNSTSSVNAVARLTQIATVQAPTAFAARKGDTSLYVTEQVGRVRRLRRTNSDFTVDVVPVIDISSDVTAGGEQGLLGLAFSADGTRLYLAFTNRAADQQVDEVTLEGDRVVGGRRTLLVVPDFAPNHNGGDLVLGPDGFLYYTMGDGGGGGDPRHTGQDPNDLLGAILRIDPTRPSGGKPYSIPADNPFANGQRGAPEVFHFGLRNPWRIAFDRETKELWIADVGQNKSEEIDVLPAGTRGGANFGWNAVEGTLPFAANGPPSGAVAPIYEYDHSNGRCSVTGGYVYRGRAIPSLTGTYLFGDNCQGDIQGLTRATDGTITITALGLHVQGLSSFGEDNDGEVYALGVSDGSVSRLDPVPVEPAKPAATAPPTTAPPTPVFEPLSPDPATAADQLVAAELVIHDPAASREALNGAAHLQQIAYRRLGQHPELFEMILSHAPAEVRDAIAWNLITRNELALIPGGRLQDTLPAWRVTAPPPQGELLAYYHEAEQQFGVGWNYLAAINLIESAMGRIQGLSSAGAQGPMQFMPATWDHYGGGGDINSPHDSIIAAARYLAANGFAEGNVDGSLYNYNNSEHYVNAVKNIAAVIGADGLSYRAYYRWEVFYVTTVGDVHLPVGYETPERIPAAEYIATHPQEG